MFRIVLKIALLAGAAFWVLSGNRSIELIALFAVIGSFAGYDFIPRQKSLGDGPDLSDGPSTAEKILDGIIIVILFALGAFILKANNV